MAVNLTTEADLAKKWGKPVEWVAERRRRNKWPHIDMGRFDKRYTDQHIEQILADLEFRPTARPSSDAPTAFEAPTSRSAKRGAA